MPIRHSAIASVYYRADQAARAVREAKEAEIAAANKPAVVEPLSVARTRMGVWNEEKERFLRENYGDTANKILAVKLSVSIHTVQARASNAGLQKSEAYRRKMGYL